MALRPEPFHVLELCAGAGGLGLGIKLAVPGTRGVAYVEREAAAAAKLVHRMETGDLAPAPVWSDLATFDARAWRGRVHCVASGDPCQPNSVAGKRGGADDDRFLADQVLRIVDECRPHRLFRENVPGNADGQLAALAPALEGMGYRVAAGIFSSAETGNSHRRERLIIMADREDGAGRLYARQWRPEAGAADAGGIGGSVGDAERAERRQGAGQREGAGSIGLSTRREQGPDRPSASGAVMGDAKSYRRREGWPEHARQQGRRPVAGDGGELAQPDDAHLQGRRAGGDARGRQEQTRHARHARLVGGGMECVPLVCPGPGDAGWPSILAVAPQLEPAVCRVAHAMADRVDRLRLLGNGVDPVAAAYAWICLDALHREAAGVGDGAGVVAVRNAA